MVKILSVGLQLDQMETAKKIVEGTVLDSQIKLAIDFSDFITNLI